MAKNNTSIEQRRIDLQIIEIRYDFFKKLFSTIKWWPIAYYAYKSISVLAGKLTLADVKFTAMLNEDAVGISLFKVILIVLIAIAIAIAGIIYGRWEARLRKNTVERLSKQIEALQLKIDPTRSSSMLTPRGDTAERDKR